jgi:hypothetical protein
MSKGYYRHRGTANAASIPHGTVTVLTLDPLRCSAKNNRELRSGEYVYFITSNSGLVKIGTSKSPWSRLVELQVGNPEPLNMALLINCGKDFGKAGVERAVHLTLGSSRIRGEWFDATAPAVSQFINAPNTLPWKVIEGMVRLGIRTFFHTSTYPKHIRPSVEEKKVKAVKTQFPRYLSQKL